VYTHSKPDTRSRADVEGWRLRDVVPLILGEEGTPITIGRRCLLLSPPSFFKRGNCHSLQSHFQACPGLKAVACHGKASQLLFKVWGSLSKKGFKSAGAPPLRVSDQDGVCVAGVSRRIK